MTIDLSARPTIAHPTLSDVAAIAGVSIKTASRVLNGSENVSLETEEKVKKAVELIGYRSNRIARELRGGSLSNIIGMVISDLANPFYAGLAAGAEETLSNVGLELILATARDNGERERVLIESLLERRVRGLIIVPSGDDYSYLHMERRRGFSFVFVDRPAPYLDADTVLVDNQGGINACVDKLVSLGCKRIALIADKTSIWTASERIEGFKKAIITRKLDSDHSMIVSGIHTSAEAESATIELLKSKNAIDGIIAANDLIAFGVGQVKSKLNPNLHVVSFDEFPSAHHMGVHTLNHDPQRLGRLTAEVILKRMNTPISEVYETAVMRVEIAKDSFESENLGVV